METFRPFEGEVFFVLLYARENNTQPIFLVTYSDWFPLGRPGAQRTAEWIVSQQYRTNMGGTAATSSH